MYQSYLNFCMVTIASISFLALVVYSLLESNRNDARARTRKLQSLELDVQDSGNSFWDDIYPMALVPLAIGIGA